MVIVERQQLQEVIADYYLYTNILKVYLLVQGEENPQKYMYNKIWPDYPEIVLLFQGAANLLEYMAKHIQIDYGSWGEYLWENTEFGDMERRKFNQMWRNLLSTHHQQPILPQRQ